MKPEWVIQQSMPWSTPDAGDKRRMRRAARYSKACAVALAEMFLVELGQNAKLRAYNPTTGDYEALIMLSGAEAKTTEDRIKRFNGNDRNTDPA